MISVERLDAARFGVYLVSVGPPWQGRRRPEPLDGVTAFEGRPTSGRWRSVAPRRTTGFAVSGGVLAAPFQARPRPPYNALSDVYLNR